MRVFAKLSSFFRRGFAEREMEREIAAHLALLQDDFERTGMAPREARLAALRAYGGVEQSKELHRDERSFLPLEEILQDFRHAGRGLCKTPGFTLVAVATLTLGIGVNTAMFSLYNSVALKPLPVADPGRVVRLERWFASGSRGNVQYAFSYPEYAYCRDRTTVFSSVVAASWPARVSTASETMQVQFVSSNYFAGIGVPPRIGRAFMAEEDAVAVLSHAAWQRKFQSDPQILGRVVSMNGVAVTVIGVAPPDFSGTLDEPVVPDFWAPQPLRARLAPGSEPGFQLLARLAPAVSRQRAQAETDALIRQFDETLSTRDRTTAITLQRTALFGNTDDWRFQILVAALMLIVGMVLLVACANLANMLLARGAARQREIAIRLALGAGRWRVARHLLTESVLLAVLGGAGALLVSQWATRTLWLWIERMLMPAIAGVSYQIDLSPDVRVFGYGLVVSLAAGVLFGLSPALRFTRNLSLRLARTESRSRLRSILLAAQVAVSMMLLISTGFLMRGLWRSQATSPGFETRHVFLMLGDYGREPARERQLLERLRGLEELRGVAQGSIPMLGTWTPPIQVGTRSGRTLASRASGGYFDTLGITLLRGRTFTPQDIERDTRVAVVSDATARNYWPDGDPIGKRLTLDTNFRGKLTDFEVIGIVKDVRFANLTRIDPAHVYLPINAEDSRVILVRPQGDPQRALAAVRSAVQAVMPELLPGLLLPSLEDGPVRIQRSTAEALALFASILASIALLLAAIGVYGVMAYLVSQRTREIGIRMALGAAPGAVLQAEVVRGLRPVLVGMVLGFAAAGGLFSVLHATLVFPSSTDFFYGVPFYDPATFLGIGAFLAAIAMIASAVPARRALRVDPMIALRHE